MKVKLAVALLAVVIVIATPSTACSSSGAAPAPQPTSTPIEEAASTVLLTSTPIPVPTASPAPEPAHTTTPQPTSTAVPPSLKPGEQAPDFELTLFDGNPLRLSDLKGKVVVLNFWASWCAPCRREMPAFEEMWEEYRDNGVMFLGVAVSDFDEDARAFAAEVGVTYPLGLDVKDEVARSYYIDAMPTTYFIDREGNVARKLTGYVNQGVLRVFINGQIQ